MLDIPRPAEVAKATEPIAVKSQALRVLLSIAFIGLDGASFH
ncbi:hypothetical protein RISK_000205 [Rhodopirellula islandica]|uniref:MFS transporter n=1 Tax=Rhodopirellula islandica TaxID=595434 RepID=A0A0J1BMK7_RHOIS|nr:hypothetical protein RISK_000205 [Rhodopirellula islandica]